MESADLMNSQTGEDIRLQKKQLRKKIRTIERKLTPEEKALSDSRITEKLKALSEYQNAHTVFAFAGTSKEIDTRDFLDDVLAQGKKLCLPLSKENGVMELKVISSLDELCPGAYGISEPPENAETVEPSDVDFALIPCVSCSSDGKRLGHGGGYYDRFLEKYDGFAVMICRSALMTEDIPVEPHDRLIENVVTDL